MKNLVGLSLAALLFIAVQSHAQTVKHDAHVVAHKTSEVAAKGKAVIVDRRYAGKYGPGGETIYIDKYSKYYYVNKLGHHVYVTKVQLRSHK